MRKFNLVILFAFIPFFTNCGSKNENQKVDEENEVKIENTETVQEKTESSKVLSKSDVEKLNILDQKKYLSEHYNLDYQTLLKMSDQQFPELLELHLNGIFDNKSLNQAWKEWANLNDEDSKKYIEEHFHNYKNMSVILSIYGPQFYNK